MEVGYELIRQQVFFRRELKERVHWFIRLRWLAAAAGLTGTAAAGFFYPELPLRPLLVIFGGLLAYNLAAWVFGRWLEAKRIEATRPYQLFAHAQFSLDLTALFLLIHFTGGAASPLVSFVFFHIILVGVLLDPAACYAYSVLTSLALAGFFFVPGAIPEAFRAGSQVLGYPAALLAEYLTYCAGFIITAYLTTSVKVALRTKSREVLRISRDLEIGNTKLTSLYGMIKEAGAHQTMQALMDSAVRNAAQIMGVKACSIKLYDPEQNCLRFASTYGLSENYLAKDCISVAKSAVNRQIIEGSLYTISSIDATESFQYPEDIKREGIASMLCLPLKAEGKTLGVFCVYSGETGYFKEGDAEFFSLMTDLTALAMERLQREIAKTWFLNKAAHQIRSPLNAILSMLQVLFGQYVGPVNEQQKEILERAQKRLSVLGQVINDLLKLAVERREAGRPQLQTLDPALALKNVIPIYQAQAQAKGVTLEAEIAPHLPWVKAQDKLLDEIYNNLVSNAVKYTPEGGQVRVSLGPNSFGEVVFQVADTGIGIPEAEQGRLFSEFFRAENARALMEEGTGLGLVIVKEIADHLGGRLELTSRPGRGTTVACTFPGLKPQPKEAKPGPPKP